MLSLCIWPQKFSSKNEVSTKLSRIPLSKFVCTNNMSLTDLIQNKCIEYFKNSLCIHLSVFITCFKYSLWWYIIQAMQYPYFAAVSKFNIIRLIMYYIAIFAILIGKRWPDHGKNTIPKSTLDTFNDCPWR